MSEELSAGCQRPSTGPAEADASVETAHAEASTEHAPIIKKETPMIQVGKKAPDFTAAGFQKDNFINVTLSEHLGKWVVLCFYPGDFTFV